MLEAHQSEDIRNSHRFKSFFEPGKEYSNCECLWGRGILPAMEDNEYDCNFMDSGWEGVEVSNVKKSTNFDSLFVQVNQFGTDGSGGPSWVPKEIRKVACAVSVVQFGGDSEIARSSENVRDILKQGQLSDPEKTFRCYRSLDVLKSASADEVRKAFKRRALSAHPDKPGGHKAVFQSINEAFQVLQDEGKRARYDEKLSSLGGTDGMDLDDEGTGMEGHVTIKDVAWLSSGVKGRQMVPRAETTGGIQVKKQAAFLEVEGPLGIISDAMYFVIVVSEER
jgi:hypothetical protein